MSSDILHAFNYSLLYAVLLLFALYPSSCSYWRRNFSWYEFDDFEWIENKYPINRKSIDKNKIFNFVLLTPWHSQ